MTALYSPLLIWADLAGPLAGDPPMLDGLLCARAALLQGKWIHVSRDGPAPPLEAMPEMFVGSTTVDGWPIPHCSNPIIGTVNYDIHEHYHRRFPVEQSHRLASGERTQINTTGGELKSYRLPNRVRGVSRVCWIVDGNWREMRKLLKDVTAMAKDRSQGYGTIKRNQEVDGKVLAWGCRDAPELAGRWWFAPSDAGMVLMRQLPFCDWLPKGLVGYRRDYCAVCPPFWHSQRNTESVVPC